MVGPRPSSFVASSHPVPRSNSLASIFRVLRLPAGGGGHSVDGNIWSLCSVTRTPLALCYIPHIGVESTLQTSGSLCEACWRQHGMDAKGLKEHQDTCPTLTYFSPVASDKHCKQFTIYFCKLNPVAHSSASGGLTQSHHIPPKPSLL